MLAQAQSSLPHKAEKRLSNLIHTGVVEGLSELLEATLARPYGLAGGAMISAMGISILYVISIQGGFGLRGSEIIILWVIGYCTGLIVEFLISLLKRR